VRSHHLVRIWPVSLSSTLQGSKLSFILVSILSLLCFNACDTGFGEPCTLPNGDAIQEACSSPPVEQGDENGTTQSASATCALDNFPGCSTFLCLKYRGANPYCSLRCQSSGECDGGVCCPLVGDCRASQAGGVNNMSVDPNAMMSMSSNDQCANAGDCYCIRSGDLGR
jgi:hypothetical protein